MEFTGLDAIDFIQDGTKHIRAYYQTNEYDRDPRVML
jgi:hypothetical protein